jgi:hypothetical protein
MTVVGLWMLSEGCFSSCRTAIRIVQFRGARLQLVSALDSKAKAASGRRTKGSLVGIKTWGAATGAPGCYQVSFQAYQPVDNETRTLSMKAV